MAKTNVELCNALRKAGAPDDDAELAAKSVAEINDVAEATKRLDSIDRGVHGLELRVTKVGEKLDHTNKLLWGVLIVLVLQFAKSFVA